MKKLTTLILTCLLIVTQVEAKVTISTVQVKLDKPDINLNNFTYNNTNGEYTITSYDNLHDVLRDAALKHLTTIIINVPNLNREEFTTYLNSTYDSSLMKDTNVSIWLTDEVVSKLEYHLDYTPDFEALLAYRKPEMYKVISKEGREVLDTTKYILSKIINGEMTYVQQSRAIHDYLIKQVTYSYDAKGDIRSVHTLLTEKKGVCDAYTRQYALMMNMLGYNCRREIGRAMTLDETGQEKLGGHAWNVTLINGKEVYTDVTWDDMDNGKVLYDYFNISSEIFYIDHFPEARQTSYYTWVK